MGLGNVLRNWKMVFGNFRYLVLAVVIAFLFYALNVLIANYNNLVTFYPVLGFWGTGKFFFTMMNILMLV